VATLLIAALATTARAESPSPPPLATVSSSVVEKAKTNAPPNFDAMMSVVDKMFPPQPAPDPARLALARTSVGSMWPDGAYARMMSGFVGNMLTGVMQMKQSDLAGLSGKAAKTSTHPASDTQTIHDKAVAKDPYFDQRVVAIRGVIDEEIGKMSVVIDPRIRDGLARSMARRFDARQLTDINTFFATPSGHALASESLQLWFEPDMLRAMMSAFPEMMKLMPDAMQKLKAANDKFPKPPTPAKTSKH
jgi:hypothetical protein